MRQRSLLVALVLSLALHVCLLLWLRRAPPPVPPPPGPAPLEVELVFTEAPGEAVRPAAAPAAPERPAPRSGSSPATAGAPAPDEGAPPSPPGPELSLDAPRGPSVLGAPRVTLVPRSDFVVPATPGLAQGAAPSAAPGRTRRATDAGEDTAQRLAREGLEAGARVLEWSTEALAEGRVRDGRMHPYYGELRRALEAQVRTPPEGLRLPSVPQDLAAQYLKQARRYGAGGAPVEDFAPGVERQLQTIAQGLPAFERELERDASRASAVGRRLTGKGAEAPGVVLRAVVELRQAPGGGFTGQVLVTSSGNPLFDAFVLERAPLALAGLAPPPAQVGPKGLRSTWAFEGRITFRRKLREFDLRKPDDAAYLAALLGTGQLAGSFDLTNLKDTEVPDVRFPRWDIRVVPLRVY